MTKPKKPLAKIETSNRFERLRYSESRVRDLFAFLFSIRDVSSVGTLSIAFLSDEELARLHADFLDDPAPTDVITFPADPEENHAGEICVSAERAETEASSRGVSFARELTLYLVHGWLHLEGFDDRSEKDCQEMRSAEEKTIDAIDKAGLFPDFRLAPKPLSV